MRIQTSLKAAEHLIAWLIRKGHRGTIEFARNIGRVMFKGRCPWAFQLFKPYGTFFVYMNGDVLDRYGIFGGPSNVLYNFQGEKIGEYPV